MPVCIICGIIENVKRRQLKCKDFRFMCDDDAKKNPTVYCDKRSQGRPHGNQTLQKSKCEMCKVKKDTSWLRTLEGAPDPSVDKKNAYRRVLCYECARGDDGRWRVLVKGKSNQKEIVPEHRC